MMQNHARNLRVCWIERYLATCYGICGCVQYNVILLRNVERPWIDTCTLQYYVTTCMFL